MLKKKIVIATAAVFGALAVFSCIMIASILVTAALEQRDFDELARTVESTSAAAVSAGDATPTDVDYFSERSILPEYAELHERNSDLFGWLSIDGTPINYPVMNDPDDPEFYIDHNFDRKRSNGGAPFLNSKCTEWSGIYIIYGHNMTNSTAMFSTLPKYKDREYWEQHKTIRFNTLYERGEYEIVAAFYSRIYKPGEEGFKYYEYTDLSDRETFDSFITQVGEAALYDTGVTAEYCDDLILLSTCNYHVRSGRFVVVARKKQ